MGIPSIHSNKHEVVFTALAEDASSVKTITLLQGVEIANADAGFECPVGRTVKSIYVEFNLSAETTTVAKVVHWQIYGQKTGESIAVPSLYYQDNRANIVKRGMEMLVRDQSTLIKRIFVVRIPKKYQRVTKNLLIRFQYVSTSANTQNMCGVFIWKELY